jgi:hypothetical protein
MWYDRQPAWRGDMPARQSQDVWECVMVEFFSDPSPCNDLLVKLIEIGERIGLDYLECDESWFSYEVTQPIEQARIITAMRAGAAMLAIGLRSIELHRFDETLPRDEGDDVVLWRWTAMSATS